VFLAIIVAAGVSFAVASVLLGFGRGEPKEEEVVAPDSDEALVPPSRV
jgi:hypothetical protein